MLIHHQMSIVVSLVPLLSLAWAKLLDYVYVIDEQQWILGLLQNKTN